MNPLAWAHTDCSKCYKWLFLLCEYYKCHYLTYNVWITPKCGKPVTDLGWGRNRIPQNLSCITNTSIIEFDRFQRESYLIVFKQKRKTGFFPTVGIKALSSAVHLLFHLLSSSKQLNVYDTQQWELHIHKTSLQQMLSCHYLALLRHQEQSRVKPVFNKTPLSSFPCYPTMPPHLFFSFIS